jgi:hypothetical protein
VGVAAAAGATRERCWRSSGASSHRYDRAGDPYVTHGGEQVARGGSLMGHNGGPPLDDLDAGGAKHNTSMGASTLCLAKILSCSTSTAFLTCTPGCARLVAVTCTKAIAF